jgi:phage gp36-like protein
MVLPVSIAVVSDVMNAQPLFSSADYITSAVVAIHMGQAEATIWAKLASRYSVPILPAPPLIVSIDMDLSIYAILVKQAILANTLEDSPWPDRYKETMELLDALAAGSMSLVSASGTVIDESTSVDGQSFVSGTENYPIYSDGIGAVDSFVDPDKISTALGDRYG